MTFKKCLNNIAKDIAVNALDEFDLNFERGGFFGKKWKDSSRVSKHNAKYKKKRKTLIQTGTLRRSLRKRIMQNGGNPKIKIFADGVKYAKIHNEGGKINQTVTVPEFKRKAHTRKIKGKTQKVKAHTVGSHTKRLNYTMPKRQFLGNHPGMDKQIEKIINDNLKEYFKNKKLGQP